MWFLSFTRGQYVNAGALVGSIPSGVNRVEKLFFFSLVADENRGGYVHYGIREWYLRSICFIREDRLMLEITTTSIELL